MRGAKRGSTIARITITITIGIVIMIAIGSGACSRETGEQPSAIEPATKDYADASDAALSVPPPPAPTAAPANAKDSAAAEALFQEARKLMDEGKYAEACPKLEESDRLDPADGTLLNLATCYEHLGDGAKACAKYAAALKSLRSKTPVNAAREKFVLEHMAAGKCPSPPP